MTMEKIMYSLNTAITARFLHFHKNVSSDEQRLPFSKCHGKQMTQEPQAQVSKTGSEVLILLPSQPRAFLSDTT